jgi:hypothetical protein
MNYGSEDNSREHVFLNILWLFQFKQCACLLWKIVVLSGIFISPFGRYGFLKLFLGSMKNLLVLQASKYYYFVK